MTTATGQPTSAVTSLTTAAGGITDGCHSNDSHPRFIVNRDCFITSLCLSTMGYYGTGADAESLCLPPLGDKGIYSSSGSKSPVVGSGPRTPCLGSRGTGWRMGAPNGTRVQHGQHARDKMLGKAARKNMLWKAPASMAPFLTQKIARHVACSIARVQCCRCWVHDSQGLDRWPGRVQIADNSIFLSDQRNPLPLAHCFALQVLLSDRKAPEVPTASDEGAGGDQVLKRKGPPTVKKKTRWGHRQRTRRGTGPVGWGVPCPEQQPLARPETAPRGPLIPTAEAGAGGDWNAAAEAARETSLAPEAATASTGHCLRGSTTLFWLGDSRSGCAWPCARPCAADTRSTPASSRGSRPSTSIPSPGRQMALGRSTSVSSRGMAIASPGQHTRGGAGGARRLGGL